MSAVVTRRVSLAGASLLCLLLAVPALCATRYRDVVASGGDADEPTTVALVKSDGRRIDAPRLKGQATFARVGIEQNGRRAAWILQAPSQPGGAATLGLVIFRNDRIERVIRADDCIFGWDFARDGTAVSYETGARHFSDARFLYLRDIASGRLLARYEIPDSNGGPTGAPDSNLAARKRAIDEAPDWARGFVD